MTAACELRAPAADRTALWFSAAMALAVHAALLLAWRYAPREPQLIEVKGDAVEVALVESAPAAAVPEPTPDPPPPTPPVPEPRPVPKEPEMTMPEPPRPVTTPPPAMPARQVPKPVARPSAAARPAATVPVGARASSSAGMGKPAVGRIVGKPVYIVPPSPAYPAESRVAGEQGLVLLRVTVDARGRPSAVSVARSSGFPRLDRAAVEGGWRCRISNAMDGGQFEAPVRFTLRD
jgi:protein TonB